MNIEEIIDVLDKSLEACQHGPPRPPGVVAACKVCVAIAVQELIEQAEERFAESVYETMMAAKAMERRMAVLEKSIKELGGKHG